MTIERPGALMARRLPIGAEPAPGGAAVRVWAPAHDRVELVTPEGASHPLAPEEGGYFAAWIPGLGPGGRYRFRLGGEDALLPDPASRRQPEGPHGWSEVVDPQAFAWTDAAWPGVRMKGQVIYEMHVGTFTPEGTWAAAMAELPRLKELGVTLIEMMPVAGFGGGFGWGYDGVNLFAPTHLYGTPDDLRRFIDRAHALGLGVVLDVVYNHFGPDGNYIPVFAPDFMSESHVTDWGQAINYDGPNAHGARDFVCANAAHWIAEYHFDGLRLDATDRIVDDSPDHILAALTRAARAAAGGRGIALIAENEPHDLRLVRPPSEGGYGLDAIWNDDFHHAAVVAATGQRRAYRTAYRGTPQELVSAARHGTLFQGQGHGAEGRPRGTPGRDVPPEAFVLYLENHDQVSTAPRGRRFRDLTSPGRARAMTALMLLLPGTPMLFQGQEIGATSPFVYFADVPPDLRDPVREGRWAFLAQFPHWASPELDERRPDPSAEDTFRACALRAPDPAARAEAEALHRDLLRLRREDPVLREQRPGALDGAVLGPEAFVLRWFAEAGDGVRDGAGDRLLLVNLGLDLDAPSLPEPLLAPPAGCTWAPLWSSEHPAYGGGGTPRVQASGRWFIPGHAAVMMAAGVPPAEGSA